MPDLDTSIIDALPPGRKPVETAVIPDTRRREVVERVHKACATGQQAYWVCTLIEESEALQYQAATDTAEALQESLPGLEVALLHGQDEKRGQGNGDGSLHARGGRPAGGNHRHRGGCRCPQRLADDHRERGTAGLGAGCIN